MSYPIPDAALDGRLAVVGLSGSGKSTTAKGGVEKLLDAGRRVCVVDLLDGWWGLRLKRDGKTPAFPVIIFGGAHGDLPLTENAGKLIGRAVAQSKESTIVCLDALDGDAARRRFARDFFDGLHAANRAPLHLVVDEADFHAPQQPVKDGPGPHLLNRIKEIAARGRMRGFRCWLITQRTAKMHWDVLSQAETLVAHQLTTDHDRKAIDRWVAANASAADGQRALADIASFEIGEAVVWSPRRQLLRRERFPLPRTYDSMRTPEYGDTASDVALAPLDLGTLKGRLSSIEEEARANDPAALKAELTKLKRDMARAAAQAAKQGTTPDPEALVAAERRGYSAGAEAAGLREIDALRRVKASAAGLGRCRVAEIAEAIAAHAAAIDGEIDAIQSAPLAPLPAGPRSKPAKPPRAPASTAGPPGAAPPVDRRSDAPPAGISNPQFKVLGALAWWAAMGHHEPTKAQLAAALGWAVRGSNLRGRLAELSTAGLIAYPATGRVAMTDAGSAAAPAPDLGATLVDSIRGMLTNPQRAVFDAIHSAGVAVSKNDLGARLGWEPGGSNLRGRLAELSVRELIDYPSPGVVRLQSWVTG